MAVWQMQRPLPIKLSVDSIAAAFPALLIRAKVRRLVSDSWPAVALKRGSIDIRLSRPDVLQPAN